MDAPAPAPASQVARPAAPDAVGAPHVFSTSPAWEWTLRGLLAFIPAAIAVRLLGGDLTLVFLLAAIAIMPLAALLGRATEEYAVHAGPALGGLLNATFGNAVELIIALVAVSAGLFEVVKASLTGSILANLLLVLGMAMFAGGVKHKTQSLHRRGTLTALSLMTLSVIALALPALFYWSTLAPGLFGAGTQVPSEAVVHGQLRALSLVVATVMIAVYVLGLVYSLRTHRHLFHEEVPEEAADWSKRRALAVMGIATGGVALMAEVLVSSIEGLTRSLGLTEIFVGVVIIAIVGNAAEHSTAILVALKNKMDLAFQISAGSSTQIALFVAPAIVFFSFAIGRPMELLFEVFELFSIAVAVAVAYAVSIDEESNWFEGALLVAVYLIICAVFFFHP